MERPISNKQRNAPTMMTTYKNATVKNPAVMASAAFAENMASSFNSFNISTVYNLLTDMSNDNWEVRQPVNFIEKNYGIL